IHRLAYLGIDPYEACAAGVDRDGDWRAGCADPDCASRCAPRCLATELETPACVALGDRCGDGVCTPARETCALCPADCGACATACGDGRCDAGETCAGDCP
ncbi:MAG: hypothetical protein NT062_30070, partial [Proteobacteria bacterium]|nr:hypothetical protein [Pseudomonadota bacterium]